MIRRDSPFVSFEVQLLQAVKDDAGAGEEGARVEDAV